MKTNYRLGYIAAILSALIFGVMPLMTKTIFAFGANFISSAFYRMFLSLPIVYFLVKLAGQDIRLRKEELLVYIAGGISFALTGLNLYNSYNYINSGLATVLHFTYPLMIFIFNALIFKEKASKGEILSIILASLGIILIADLKGGVRIEGVFLSVFSALMFAIHCLLVERTRLREVNRFKLLFYVNLFGALTILAYSLIKQDPIQLGFTPGQWGILFAYSVLLTVVATLAYHVGIQHIGSNKTGMLSTVEPIISIIIGYLFLNEAFTASQGFALVLVLLASVILILGDREVKIKK